MMAQVISSSPLLLMGQPLAKVELHIGDIVWLTSQPELRNLKKLCTINIVNDRGALDHPAVVIDLLPEQSDLVRMCVVRRNSTKSPSHSLTATNRLPQMTISLISISLFQSFHGNMGARILSRNSRKTIPSAWRISRNAAVWIV